MAEGSRDAATGLSKLGDEAKNAENDTKNLGDTIKGAFATSELSDAASAIAENIRGIVDESKEHLKIMSALEASSQLAGYTAEQTAETYKILYGVLADDQTAATTTANLQALGLSQEELTRLTYGTIGAWTKYGDSIPIDGLAEAVNETVKTGTVTGTFADVLNWAGTSEDDFNTKLQATTDQSKRANMILQELADQGLIASAEAYRDNNKALIENNEAQAEYQEALSDLSETLMPVFTSITEAITELIEIFNSLPAPVQAVIGVILGIITILTILSPAIMAVSSLFSIFGASAGVAAGGAAAAGTAASGSAVGFGLLNMSLLPVIATILAVVAVVAAVILIFKNWDEIVKWFQDQFANFGAAISDYVDDIGSFFHNMFDGISQWLSDSIDGFASWGSEMYNKVSTAVSDTIDAIASFFTGLPGKAIEWGSDMIDGFVDGITGTIGKVVDAVSDVADTVFSWLHFSRPDKGPLREYEEWMPDMMSGLSKGIKDNRWRVEDEIASLASNMNLAYNPAIESSAKNVNESTVIVNVRADLNGRDITKYVEKEISANQKSMRLVRGY